MQIGVITFPDVLDDRDAAQARKEVAVSADRNSRPINAAGRSPQGFGGRLREGAGCPGYQPPPSEEVVRRRDDYDHQVRHHPLG